MVFQFFCSQCSTRSMFYTLFSISLCTILHVWILQHILDFVDNINVMISAAKLMHRTIDRTRTPDPTARMKYILTWNSYYLIANNSFGSVFTTLNCSVRNCYFTTDKYLLTDFTKFDAVIFNEEILNSSLDRPMERGPSQIFVFTTIESSYNKAACELDNDDFFNWTFTYRLDSDVLWKYFAVLNASGAVVAPRVDVSWQQSAIPPKPEIKAILRGKTKAAAWIVSHCEAESLRDDYLTRLQHHLYHFSLKIDVYGRCNKMKCTNNNNCDDMLTQNYRFYMAFENSICEDYVSEKILHGYKNYAVPIVYGGANYSRFLPPGSYINAREMHPYNLAFTIYEAIKNDTLFESYFQWTNIYSFEECGSNKYHPLCDLCAALHEDRARHAPAKKDFRVWWNGLNGMKRCLPAAYWQDNARIIIDNQDVVNQY